MDFSAPIKARTENETALAAARLAAGLKAGDILLLRGNLGAGKTAFARALIRALCSDTDLEVPSPTFTLVQTYDTAIGQLFHFDLYRLKDAAEIYELGWEDALAGGVTVVEWPERLGPHTPARYLDISLKAVDNEPDTRIIEITRV